MRALSATVNLFVKFADSSNTRRHPLKLSYPDAIINSRVYSCCVALEQTLAAYVLASIFYSIQISNNSIRNIVFSYALVQEFLVYINGFTFLIFRRNWLFVCLSSVCLSVKLVHPYAGIESKQLNVSSNFFSPPGRPPF